MIYLIYRFYFLGYSLISTVITLSFYVRQLADNCQFAGPRLIPGNYRPGWTHAVFVPAGANQNILCPNRLNE
jgi:hypothetical protein